MSLYSENEDYTSNAIEISVNSCQYHGIIMVLSLIDLKNGATGPFLMI